MLQLVSPDQVDDVATKIKNMTPPTISQMFTSKQSLSERDMKRIMVEVWGRWDTSDVSKVERRLGMECSVCLSLDVVWIPWSDYELKIKLGRTFGNRLMQLYPGLPCHCPEYAIAPL